MRAGQFDRRVIFREIVDARDETFGASVPEKLDEVRVWARKMPLWGREVWAARQTTAKDVVRYQVRWHPKIKNTMEIVDGDQSFDIFHIGEFGRKKILEITGVARGK